MDRITWHEYFMRVALLTSLRSEDTHTKVGSCIIRDKKILGTGYNGFPAGTINGAFTWEKASEKVEETKYPYVIHAEINNIFNCNTFNLKDSIIYCTHKPCADCLKTIILARIKMCIYLNDYSKNESHKKITEKLINNVDNFSIHNYYDLTNTKKGYLDHYERFKNE